MAKSLITLANNLSETIKTAGRKNRKQLEKDVAFAKDTHNKRKSSLSQHKADLERLQSLIEQEEQELSSSRKDIMRAYDVMRNMDLHDIAEVRYINDDVSYIKNNRLFRLDKDDLVPFKSKKKDEAEVDDEGAVLEEEMDDDEILDVDDFFAAF